MIKLDIEQRILDRQASEGRRITVSEVAKEVKVTRATLYRYINGEAKGVEFATLEALADYFNCPPGDLLVREK